MLDVRWTSTQSTVYPATTTHTTDVSTPQLDFYHVFAAAAPALDSPQGGHSSDKDKSSSGSNGDADHKIIPTQMSAPPLPPRSNKAPREVLLSPMSVPSNSYAVGPSASEFSTAMHRSHASQMQPFASSLDSTSSMHDYGDTALMPAGALYAFQEQRLPHVHQHDERYPRRYFNDNLSPFKSFTPDRKPSLNASWLGNSNGMYDEDQGDYNALYFDRSDNESGSASEQHSFVGSSNNLQRFVSPSTLTGSNGPTRWFETEEIVLRAINGDRLQDVYYPRNPSLDELMSSLQDPNAPPTMAIHSAATTHHLQFYGYGAFGQVPRQYFAGSFSAAGTPRMLGALPYRSPSLESYLLDDKVMRPRRQDEKLRFPGDLYTPRWVRGEGTAREGWCSLCREGHWMQLKTSQYWYHVRFSHGVNSNTGRIYEPPMRLRVCDDPFASTFGLCSECQQWVPICTPRRKRSFTSWFKHAHKCHRIQCLMPASMSTMLATYPMKVYEPQQREAHQQQAQQQQAQQQQAQQQQAQQQQAQQQQAQQQQAQQQQQQQLQRIATPYSPPLAEPEKIKGSPTSTPISFISSPASGSGSLHMAEVRPFPVSAGSTTFNRMMGSSNSSSSSSNASLAPQRYSWHQAAQSTAFTLPFHALPAAQQQSSEVSAASLPSLQPSSVVPSNFGPQYSTLAATQSVHRRSNSDGLLMG